MTRSTLICISCIFLILMSAVPGYAQIDPESVLGMWLLDEGTGDTTEDASGNGNDGTLMNTPNWGCRPFRQRSGILRVIDLR